MAVFGRKVGRADLRLVRGDSERVSVWWRQRNVLTGVVTPVDMSWWSGRLELRSPDGSELWYSQACGSMTSDGYAIADIPPSALSGDGWVQRRAGRWRIRATGPGGGVVRTLAWGYFTLSD